MNHLFRILFILFVSQAALSSQTTDAGLRSLAEYISMMTSAPCSHIFLDNTQAIYSAATAQNCPTARSFGNDPREPKVLQSTMFFELGQKAYAELLKCEYDKIKDFSFDSPYMIYELASRSSAIKELSKQISSLTGQWQLLNAKIPKSGNLPLTPQQKIFQNQANLINEDIKNLMSQKEMLQATTPYGQYPQVQRFMETSDLSQMDAQSTRIQLRNLRASVVADIETAKKTADSSDALPSVVKERIVQDPILMDYIFKKNNLKKEEHKSLLCYLDSVYGEGAKKRDAAITIATTIAGLGAGSLIMRGLVAAWRTGRISAAAWNTGQRMASINAGTIGGTASMIELARAVEKDCSDQPNFNLAAAPKSANQCDGASMEREIEEGNCFLSFALPAMGAVVSAASLPAELSALQKLTNSYKERREVKKWLKQRKPQVHFQKLAAMRTKGNLAEAAEYENKLKTYMETNDVIDRKRVGTGISNARYVEFPDGTVGIWKKSVTTIGKNKYSSANSELAAYKLDNYLGYHRVPITISKKLNGEEGTVQLLVDNLGNFKKGQGQEEMSLFDYLIHNFDRTNNPDNLLYTSEGHVVAIDHGFAFMNDWKSPPKTSLELLHAQSKPGAFKRSTADSLMNFNAAKSKRDQLLVAIVGDKGAFDKLKSTSPEDWRKFFASTLDENEISFFLIRRKEVIDAVDAAHGRFGDSIFRGPHSPIRLPAEN